MSDWAAQTRSWVGQNSQCTQCGGLTSKWLTSTSGICSMCTASNKIKAESEGEMVCSKCGAYTKKYYAAVKNNYLCLNCATVVNQAAVKTAKAMGVNPPVGTPQPALVRKNGDIWRIPNSSTPFGTEQWGCQGTARTPYIVTHYLNRKDGSTTADGWACSCPNYTQHTPRTECKHILKVMLANNVKPIGVSDKSMKASAAMTNEDAVAFEKWKREQAEKVAKPSDDAGDLELFGKTGRKFR